MNPRCSPTASACSRWTAGRSRCSPASARRPPTATADSATSSAFGRRSTTPAGRRSRSFSRGRRPARPTIPACSASTPRATCASSPARGKRHRTATACWRTSARRRSTTRDRRLSSPASKRPTAGAGDDTALLFHDDTLGLLTVAREGDALLGSTITGLTFSEGLADIGGSRSGFNAVGQVAYGFTLADSRTGIALFTPPAVPEPASAGLLILGGAALLRRRRA